MKAKKWAKTFVITWVLTILITGSIVVVVDPYHHYHKPLHIFDYKVGDAVYTNDGKCKNYDYEALITGTSMTSGFDEKEASELFDLTFLRATFLGEGFKRINDNLKSAIKYNENLKFVIRSVDALWFVTDVNWLGYEDYPEYLYNDVIFDDTKYLYNLEIWNEAVIPILKTLHRPKESDAFNYTELNKKHKEYLEEENALDNYVRPTRGYESINTAETNEFFSLMDKNLDINLLEVVEDNPDIEFYFYFPPYSILWWDGINQAGPGRIDRRIEMEKYAIEKILQYDNVTLFSFSNNFEMVCNLDNYSDDIHYKTNVNSEILNFMKKGEYVITKDNYLDYIDEIRRFYVNYDYDLIYK